ncbi:MAG: hypothetical protein QMD46_05130 [Methanomicrobiales archaeon]|nr:hypothetical protein [Methanomicrobiales archaeon]
MATVRNRQECRREEVHGIASRLCAAQERWALEQVLKGARVYSGEIRGLEEIGDLYTRWKHLGTIRAATLGTGLTRRFRVREVEQALSEPPIDMEEYCERLHILAAIRAHRQELNRAELKLDVAVLERDGEIFVCNGSEKVVALYSFAREKNLKNTVLPVCAIVPPPPPA